MNGLLWKNDWEKKRFYFIFIDQIGKEQKTLATERSNHHPPPILLHASFLQVIIDCRYTESISVHCNYCVVVPFAIAWGVYCVRHDDEMKFAHW